MEELIKVVAAVIGLDGQYLIARRRQGRQQGGLWEFPGGKVEADESPAESLAREIKEELGVEIIVGEFFDANVYHYDHSSIELTAYEVRLKSFDFQLVDHDDIRWVAPADFGEYDFAPADNFLLEEIKRLAIVW